MEERISLFCKSLLRGSYHRRSALIGKVCFAMVALCCWTAQIRAQDSTVVKADTVIVESRDTVFEGGPDTVAIKSYAERYDPRKAILYAAIVPGLGQIYNKKYWKLPLVYGGFYAIGYHIDLYNDFYTEYKGYLFDNIESGIGENEENPNHPPDVRLTTGQLRTIVDKSRRERDFMIILMGGMYILQMIDAHVDSHLKEFDLNPKLQVSIEPTIQQNAWTGRTTGMALVLKF